MYNKKKGKKMQSLAERRRAQLKCINPLNSGRKQNYYHEGHTYHH